MHGLAAVFARGVASRWTSQVWVRSRVLGNVWFCLAGVAISRVEGMHDCTKCYKLPVMEEECKSKTAKDDKGSVPPKNMKFQMDENEDMHMQNHMQPSQTPQIVKTIAKYNIHMKLQKLLN